MKRRGRFLLSSIFFLAGFFVFVGFASAASSDVVITEIMYDPVGSDTNHEWIELKNMGSESVEIKGGATSDSWRMFMDGANHTFSTTTILNVNEYLVVTQDEETFLAEHQDFSGKIVRMSFNLSNTSSTLGLKIGSSGTLWSEIIYDSSWGGSGNGKSLEKKVEAGDNLIMNWQESSVIGGTAGVTNSAPQVQDNPVDNTLQVQTSSTAIVAEPVKIIINEIYPISTTSTEKEWVELYNPTTSTVDVGSWVLNDNSSTTTLSGVIEANGFLVIEFSNKLNNTGDILQLYDANLNLIDKVVYGNYNDGNIADNALVGEAGQSLARKIDGEDTNSDINDFAITTNPTKNAANQITEPVIITPEQPPTTQNNNTSSGNNAVANLYRNSVFISEFLSDPQANEKEWVEIYNNSDEKISLSNWYLEEGSEEQTRLSGEILSHSYFIIESPKGNLNNSGDIIFLYDGNSNLVDKVSYGSWDDGSVSNNAVVVFDGKSVGRKTWEDITIDKDKFFITQYSTRGGANVFALNLQSDNLDNSEIIDKNPILTAVVINELLPNPKGADTDTEYIELFNNTNQEINLAKWSLKNSSGKKFVLPSSSIISANNFLSISRKISKISLKNTAGDFVELYEATNNLVDKVVYQDVANEDISYNRISATGTLWQWSTVLTPGQKNVLQLPNHAPEVVVNIPSLALVGEEILLDASDTVDLDDDELIYRWDLGNGQVVGGENVKVVYDKQGSYKISLSVDDGHNNIVEEKFKLLVSGNEEVVVAELDSKVTSSKKMPVLKNVTIDQIQNLAINTLVKTSGVVTVVPNILSMQVFYIADTKTQAGVSVYMFKKDFPDLRVGDSVEVMGELSKVSGMSRIKIKEKKDIKIIDIEQNYQPIILTMDELDSDYVGSFVELAGEVLEVNSNNFYLADEYGEIKVVIKSKTGLSSRMVKIGDKIKVKGILGQAKNSLELWPGLVEDIKITELGAGETLNADKKQTATESPYLTATAGGVSSLLLAFLARGRGLVAKTMALGVLSKVWFWKKKKEDI